MRVCRLNGNLYKDVNNAQCQKSDEDPARMPDVNKHNVGAQPTVAATLQPTVFGFVHIV